MQTYRYLFASIIVLYGAGCFGYLAFLFTGKRAAGRAGFAAAAAGFIAHTGLLVFRGAAFGYIPVTSLYESLLSFAWLLMLAYLFVEIRRRQWIDGVFILPLALSLVSYASALGHAPGSLAPALRSPWLGVHATLCFLSYACFTLAFSFAAMYLWQEHEIKSKKPDVFFFRLPALESLDRLGCRAITLGFIFLTFGIVSGSMWARQAWGSFWSWDPKETWSLVMWLMYLAYLYGRLAAGWRGRKSAWLAIAGFCVMMFTYLGVSLLLPGLHSYLQ